MFTHPLNRLIWLLTAAILLADAIMMIRSNIHLSLAPLPYFATGFIGCIIVALIGTYLLKDVSVSAFAIGMLQMNLAAIALGWFSYLTTSFNFPLRDDWLILGDRLLGFDWRNLLQWMTTRPNIADILSLCYISFSTQAIALLCMLYAFKHIAHAQCYIASFILSCLITTLLASLFPAVGAYVHYNLLPSDYPNITPVAARVHEETLLQLRAHNFTLLPWLENVKGLITFPSFHATMAVLFIYAGLPFRRIRLLLSTLNIGMIASTPIEGGHYLVDVIAGTLIGIASICAVMHISRSRPN